MGRLAWGDREGRWAVRVRWEDRGREGCRDLAGLAEGRWTLGCEGALVLALVREALVLAAPVLAAPAVPAPAALAAAVRCLPSWLARSSS